MAAGTDWRNLAHMMKSGTASWWQMRIHPCYYYRRHYITLVDRHCGDWPQRHHSWIFRQHWQAPA